MLNMKFHKNWLSTFIGNVILRFFLFQLYPTHSRSVYDPTGTILAILYSKVSHMLHAKYQPNPPGGSGEEVV